MIKIFRRKILFSDFKTNTLEALKKSINYIGIINNYFTDNIVTNNYLLVDIYVIVSPFNNSLIYKVEEAIRFKQTNIFKTNYNINDINYVINIYSDSKENILNNIIIKINSNLNINDQNQFFDAKIIQTPYNMYIFNTNVEKYSLYNIPEYDKKLIKTKNSNDLENIDFIINMISLFMNKKITRVITTTIDKLEYDTINKVDYNTLDSIDSINAEIIAPTYRARNYCYIIRSTNLLVKKDLEYIKKIFLLEDQLFDYWLYLQQD